MEEAGRKVKGVIVERSKGRSTWIRFGNNSLGKLLDVLEEWCRDESSSKASKGWKEEMRNYRLEKKSNRASSFTLCSVVDAGSKRFCVVFPEGRGFPRAGPLWLRNFEHWGL